MTESPGEAMSLTCSAVFMSVLVARPALCQRYQYDEPCWAESTARTEVPHLSTRVR